jgi:hypothetical protein
VRLQYNNKLFNRCVTITLIIQKNSLEDGTLLFYQPDIPYLLWTYSSFLRNMFKFLGHSLFLEVWTTPKEIMLFHDHGLSCCDLLAVITNSPLMALVSMSWLTGKLDVNARWPYISISSTSIFLRFSYFALLVMNFDWYLATSYPIFHWTSVTKGRRITLLALLIIVEITLNVMSVNDFVFRYQVHSVSSLLFSHTADVIYQLQTVYSRQEKS